MDFTKIIFLLFFLPVFILIYLLTDSKRKNFVILIASMFFFAWGQIYYLILMVAVVIGNYFLGRMIEGLRKQPNRLRAVVWLGCGANLLVLLFFKLLVAFGVKWLPVWLPAGFAKILNLYMMPLGLSFIDFQMISYLIDVSKGTCNSEKSLSNFALYILLFPKIIIGPIVKYRDIFQQILSRETSIDGIANGIRRFIGGLIKKILIADTIANTINPAFALEKPSFAPWIAWFALIGYAIQLYFDFSGYTDMAIGIGQMMGFRFMENFNYPYISKNIADFWRRWHISLSTWFREYVFFPLERSRKKWKGLVQPVNIMIVFVLTGLWHGIGLNFLLWGGIHGLALVFESSPVGGWLRKAWAPIQHAYAITVILLGWVFFRSPTPAYAIGFLSRLVGSTQGITPLPYRTTAPLPIIDHSVWLAMILGVLFSMPTLPKLRQVWGRVATSDRLMELIGRVSSDLALLAFLVIAVAAIVSRTNVITSIYAKF